MNDEKKINRLITAVNNVRMIPMLFLIIFAITAIQRVISCSCILLLYTIQLVLYGILKDSKKIAEGSVWYVLWLICLIVNVFRI